MRDLRNEDAPTRALERVLAQPKFRPDGYLLVVDAVADRALTGIPGRLRARAASGFARRLAERPARRRPSRGGQTARRWSWRGLQRQNRSIWRVSRTGATGLLPWNLRHHRPESPLRNGPHIRCNGQHCCLGRREFCTHFVPISADRSETHTPENHVNEPNATFVRPPDIWLITRRSQVRILPPLLKRPCSAGPFVF